MTHQVDEGDARSLAQGFPPSRRLLGGVALVSLAILLLQLTLTRLFSATMYYHFAFLAIALALFGSGASGVLVYALEGRLRSVATSKALVAAALLFAATTVAALIVILANPFSPVDPPAVTLRHLAFVYGATALPFVFGGAAISLAVARFARSMSRLYVFDLGGAAAGCLLVIPLLDRLGAIDTILAIAIVGWAAAVAFAGGEGGGGPLGPRGRAVIGVAGLVFVGLFAWNRATGHLEVRRAKGLDEAGHILFEKWNSFSRVTVWGSLLDPSVVIMIDADAGTLVLRGSGVPGQREWLMTRVEALAYHVKPTVSALVIGPGGGADVAMALAFGARSVTAVEVNPIIAEDVMSLEPFRTWSGRIFEQPGVRLVVDEARSFIRSSSERYDVIQATMVDTWAATAAGAFALTENNLYTVEAFRDYLDRLTPDGVISFTRWHMEPPDQLLRLVAIARTAMAERGIGDASRHLLVVRGPVEGQRERAPATVLLKASPFTDAEVRRLEAIAAAEGLALLYTPLTRPAGDLTRLVTAADPAAVWRSLPSDVSPTRDDRPFFFHTVRPSRLAHVRLGWDDEWQKTNLGTFVLAGLAVLTPLVTVGFILGPLALAGARAGGSGARLPWLLGFAGLGLGYVLVEVVLVQKCILFLGHPVYALTVVLFSLLAWSAVGSFLSGRVREASLGGVMPLLLIGVAGLVTAYAFGLSPLFQACVGLPRPARLLLAATVLAPLGVALGTPMPSAVRLLSRVAPRAVPWAWGVNGAASVLGSVGALVVALVAGFDRALLLGAIAYLLAVPGLRALGRSG